VPLARVREHGKRAEEQGKQSETHAILFGTPVYRTGSGLVGAGLVGSGW